MTRQLLIISISAVLTGCLNNAPSDKEVRAALEAKVVLSYSGAARLVSYERVNGENVGGAYRVDYCIILDFPKGIDATENAKRGFRYHDPNSRLNDIYNKRLDDRQAKSCDGIFLRKTERGWVN